MLNKVLPWTFSTTEPENAISRFLHFQWLTALENGGTSMYRTGCRKTLFFNSLLEAEAARLGNAPQGRQVGLEEIVLNEFVATTADA